MFLGWVFELNVSGIEIAPLLLIGSGHAVGLRKELTQFQLVQWQINPGGHEV